mmetsp:Transcript_26595/g.60820  ORF Transcript_26595/g.60820 Transcript_26595/m.60820 type:complete len:851 (-) Transcript_26595:249-2801(-)
MAGPSADIALLSALTSPEISCPRLILEASHPFKILLANPAWCALMGYSADEVVGNSIAVIYGELTCSDSLNALEFSMSVGTKVSASLVHYDKRRLPVLCSFQTTPLVNSQGHPTFSCWILHRSPLPLNPNSHVSELPFQSVVPSVGASASSPADQTAYPREPLYFESSSNSVLAPVAFDRERQQQSGLDTFQINNREAIHSENDIFEGWNAKELDPLSYGFHGSGSYMAAAPARAVEQNVGLSSFKQFGNQPPPAFGNSPMYSDPFVQQPHSCHTSHDFGPMRQQISRPALPASSQLNVPRRDAQVNVQATAHHQMQVDEFARGPFIHTDAHSNIGSCYTSGHDQRWSSSRLSTAYGTYGAPGAPGQPAVRIQPPVVQTEPLFRGYPLTAADAKLLTTTSSLSTKRTKCTPSGLPLAPFVAKLYDMVNDPAADECIYWSKSGTSFWVTNIDRFEAFVLPSYFKHNRMAFFIKQLRSYGFRQKLGGSFLDTVKEWFHAANSFCRDNPELLAKVCRINSASTKEEASSDVPSSARALERANSAAASRRIERRRNPMGPPSAPSASTSSKDSRNSSDSGTQRTSKKPKLEPSVNACDGCREVRATCRTAGSASTMLEQPSASNSGSSTARDPDGGSDDGSNGSNDGSHGNASSNAGSNEGSNESSSGGNSANGQGACGYLGGSETSRSSTHAIGVNDSGCGLHLSDSSDSAAGAGCGSGGSDRGSDSIGMGSHDDSDGDSGGSGPNGSVLITNNANNSSGSGSNNYSGTSETADLDSNSEGSNSTSSSTIREIHASVQRMSETLNRHHQTLRNHSAMVLSTIETIMNRVDSLRYTKDNHVVGAEEPCPRSCVT